MIKQNERLLSLDIFRGGVIAGFIIQNNPGSKADIFGQLLHSNWNGCTIADLGFPFFLFIAGVAMSYSLYKSIKIDQHKYKIYKKVLIRSCLLFIVGLIFENFHPFNLIDYNAEYFRHIRIMGVLQRISLTYLIASIIVIEFKKIKFIFLWTFIFIAGYWLIMMIIPVPGYGAGNLSIKGNLATYIDNLIMPNHLWEDGFDPEGLLSTIPATATVLMGVLTGLLLQREWTKIKKFKYLLICGTACSVVGLLSNYWFPINKSLWTSSYVLFTGGVALTILSVLYWIIEIKKITVWAKTLQLFGIHTLLIFLFSSLITRLINYITIPGTSNLRLILYYHLFLPLMPAKLASLLYGISYLLGWSILAWYLSKHKILIYVE